MTIPPKLRPAPPLSARSTRRLALVGALTALLTAAAVPAGAVQPASTGSRAGSTAVPADWSDDLGHQGGWDQGGWDQGGWDQGGWDQGGSDQGGSDQGGSDQGSYGGSRTATVDSRPATAAESAGVALIDTVLGYQNAAAAGTGVVLTSQGQLLTNYHVVQGATTIKVTIASTGKTYTADVVGHDQSSDVALLQLEGASGLSTATIDDDTVSTGDEVLAVGNAGGQDSLTAAEGTVTSLSETITTQSEDGSTGETLDDLIQTDADVVAGDSGGPLYDDEGEVIGIDTAASTGSEINGYAIAIDDALEVVTRIRSGHETSAVQIGAGGYLGVQVSGDATSSTTGGYPGQDASSASTSGAVVAGVLPGTPAATAGLEAGDVLTAVGATTVGSADDVSTAIQGHDAGDSVKLSWTDAEGDHHSATVTLAESPVA